jgi:hypothetical protein
MTRLGVLAAALAAGACATACATRGADTAALGAASDLPGLAATVAAQLEEAASADPRRLAGLELELRRISDALPMSQAALAAGPAVPPAYAATAPAMMNPGGIGGDFGTTVDPPAAAELSAAAAAAPASDEGYAPPPELTGARSLFSALTLGAYPNADTARAAWFGMNAAHGEALAGLDARIEMASRDDGATAYVLKAGPFASAAEAETLCQRLRAAGAVCTAGDFTGSSL